MELSLQIFDDGEFLCAFKAAWLEYFNERLQDEVQETFLADLTEEREVESEGIKSRLQEAEALCVQIENDLVGFNEKLKVANFREKSELRSSITEAEESRARSHRLQQEVEQEGCDLLLPPGYLLETLDAEGEGLVLTPDAYHPSAKIALKAWSTTPLGDLASSTLPVHPKPDSDLTAEDQQASSAFETDSAEAEASNKEPEPLDEPQLVTEPETIEAPEPNPEPVVASAVEPVSESDEQAEDHNLASSPIEVTAAVKEPDGFMSADSAEDDVNISQFFNKPTEARERLEHCQQTMDVVPAIAVENIALLWMKRGELPLASKTLEIAGRMGLAGDLLSLPLVQAAYHGMHVWRGDTATVTRVQQNLHQLSSEIIESWIYRRPGDALFPIWCLPPPCSRRCSSA
ncbi:hypothetical protein NWF32_24630 [Pseudomonas qingdaonensis]|nr:hypothetical protein [Pseudomonas qingdaonensis]